MLSVKKHLYGENKETFLSVEKCPLLFDVLNALLQDTDFYIHQFYSSHTLSLNTKSIIGLPLALHFLYQYMNILNVVIFTLILQHLIKIKKTLKNLKKG